jgi:hypothetical protein
MVALRYNRRNSFEIPYPGGKLILFPGINLAVNDELWATHIHTHPIVQTMIEHDEIDVLVKPPKPTSDIAGVPVVDNKKMGGEPVPVMPVQDRSAAKNAPAKAPKAK